MCHVLFCPSSCIITITNAASAERKAECSFNNMPIAIVSITPMQIKNKLGIRIKNSNSPTDEPRIFAFILSNASPLESLLLGAMTNTTEIMLQ